LLAKILAFREGLTIAILPTGYVMSHAIQSWIVVTHFRCEMRYVIFKNMSAVVWGK
jgi:hypothetical protein